MSLIIESCSLEELCVTLGKNKKLLIELRDKLQEWLKSQPHLPQDASPHLLEHFLLGTKMSLEQAKYKLDMFYTMRRLMPELFAGQDPRSSNFTRLHELMQIVCLPKLTPQKERVFIMRPNRGNYSKISGYDGPKYTFAHVERELFSNIIITDTKTQQYIIMMKEILMTELAHSLSSIYIFDHLEISLGFVGLFTPTVVKKMEVAATEGVATRIAGIHFVNAAPLTMNLVKLLKKVMKPKLGARIHLHSRGNYESIFQHVPKSVLPEDYGGDESPISHLADLWRKKMDNKQGWFMEQEKNLVNESLRPGSAVNGDDLFGFSGSFRKLDLD